jgi:hypothetical protein
MVSLCIATASIPASYRVVWCAGRSNILFNSSLLIVISGRVLRGKK